MPTTFFSAACKAVKRADTKGTGVALAVPFV
jgi:hypothetical protein